MTPQEKARQLRPYIEKAAVSLDDSDALNAIELFPVWVIGINYLLGDRIQYNTKLFKCIQAHTSQAEWTPDITPALWTEVEQPGQGDTPDNPIPYNNNMILIYNKYYSQYNVVYHCIRDTINPVYNDLSALVGLYVEVYNGATV